jgi:hypothetical protein
MTTKKRQRAVCKSKAACSAIICHGPGHQSKTRCRLTGKHDIHETVYGSCRQFAQWRGDLVFSGYFDEPPAVPTTRYASRSQKRSRSHERHSFAPGGKNQ